MLVVPGSLMSPSGVGTPGGGGSLWQPSTSDMYLWLDASDTSTITVTGTDVDQWDDKSVNGHVFTGTTTTRPQSGTTTQNSLNVMYFDRDYVTDAAGGGNFDLLNDGSESTIFIVFSPSLEPNPNIFFGLLGSNQAASAQTGASVWWDDRSSVSRNETLIHQTTSASQDVENVMANSSSPAQTWQMVAISGDSNNATAADRSYIYHNGNTAVQNSTKTGAANGGTSHAMQIGALGSGTAPYEGSIAEILIYEHLTVHPMNTAERQKIEGYLAWKWGIQASLPAGHPYESGAPTV